MNDENVVVGRELVLFLERGQPMLYTEFYRLVLSTLEEREDVREDGENINNNKKNRKKGKKGKKKGKIKEKEKRRGNAGGTTRTRSEEVRELMLECDPLGEGWIFPRVVSEYIRTETKKSSPAVSSSSSSSSSSSCSSSSSSSSPGNSKKHDSKQQQRIKIRNESERRGYPVPMHHAGGILDEEVDDW